MKKAVFLDRDGVINRPIIRDGKPYPPRTLEELEILPGVAEGLKRLHSAGFIIIVVTNQPDVVRGLQTRDMVEKINAMIRLQLPIDNFLVCYHDNSDNCTCRKPKPGALLQAAKQFGLNLKDCFMVGDRWSDIEAGKSAGCKTIFIDYRYEETGNVEPDYRIGDLPQAVDLILRKKGES
ncbi:MAG: HAD family hydrolase [Actinobacteria bacterium]|nr:HAD family hydrolase [Actinomycetota bacterium]